MLNYENFAITFARAVELFRSRPDAVRDQKGALRVLVALTKLGGVTMHVAADRTLTVGSTVIPPTLPGIKSLIAQLQIHGVQEIHFAQDASPAELLGLLRAIATSLAAYTGGDSLDARMRRIDARSVRVLTAKAHSVAPGGRRAPSVTEAFEAVGLSEETSAALDAATEVERPGTQLDEAIADLALDPDRGDVLGRVTSVSRMIGQEFEAGRADVVLHAISEMIRLEEGLPEGSGRSSVTISLNRLLTKPVIEEMVRLVGVVRFRERATGVLRRGRTDAIELLIEALVAANSSAERRAYFDVLREMPEGVPQFLHLLGDPRWYVVRNAVELIADMRVEAAVPYLGRILEHTDQRVRKAAAVALAQIGTPATVHHIREALQRGDAEVRTLVAGAVSGRRSEALAMPLVLAAEDEPDAETQREFYLALARIGTPEALQALIKAAQPGGRFLRRRRVETRLAAVDGLRAAGGAAAIGALESLREDRNRVVRDAARSALEAQVG